MVLKWPILLLFHIIMHISIALKFMTHPDGDLNMEQKIRTRGYPLEIHTIVTEDNYILTTHRVPYGRKMRNSNNTNKRSPVLIIHGMGAQPEYFLVPGRHSLVFYLADRGFDVWLLNLRGTAYSQKHKYLDEKDRRYWMFSYHEIGIYDIPANIDYIMNITNQKVFLVGHSQGNTCYFVMVTERPEYNEKVKLAVAYAPSVLLQYIDYPSASLFCHFVEVYQMIYDILGMGELVPISDYSGFLVKIFCSETTYFHKICMDILSVIGSHKSRLISEKTAALIFTIQPASIAARQLFHYMQGVKTGLFRQYDHGESGNLERYNSKTPPEYNLTNAVAPVALFSAERDEFGTHKAIEEIVKALPNVILHYKVRYKYFNHIDFLFGKVPSFAYKPTVQLLQSFDNGKLGR